MAPSGAGDAAYLSIQDVVKDFSGYKAVNHVSLDIAKGEIFALLGRSPLVETKDAIALLDTRPDLVAINAHLTHKGVNHRSVELDAMVKASQRK